MSSCKRKGESGESGDPRGGKKPNHSEEWALLFSALITHSGFAADIIPLIVVYCHDRGVWFDRENQNPGIRMEYLPCCGGGATISLDLHDSTAGGRHLAVAASTISKLESKCWSVRIDSQSDGDELVFGVADEHLKGEVLTVCSREFFYRHSRFIWSKDNRKRNHTNETSMEQISTFAEPLSISNSRWTRQGMIVRMKYEPPNLSVSIDGGAWTCIFENLAPADQFYPMVGLYPADPKKKSPAVTVTSHALEPVTMKMMFACQECKSMYRDPASTIEPRSPTCEKLLHFYMSPKSIRDLHRTWRVTILQCNSNESNLPEAERCTLGMTAGFLKSATIRPIEIHLDGRYIFSPYGNQVSSETPGLMRWCEPFTKDGGPWLKPDTTLDFVYNPATASISVSVDAWTPCTLWTDVDPDQCFPFIQASPCTVIQLSSFALHP